MKKLLVIILFSMIVFTLSGCGTDDKLDEDPIYSVYMLSSNTGNTELTYEEWLETVIGPQGNDGREIEIQVSGEYIQWHYEGDSSWTNLIDLGDLKGTDGLNGENGQSAFEIYLDSNPTYTGDVDQWLNDLTNGKFSDSEWYTITFDLMGGLMTEPLNEEVVALASLDLPLPVKEGYVFKGWFTGSGINDGQFMNSTPISRDMILYARWEEAIYTIDFVLNGGYFNDYFTETLIIEDNTTLIGEYSNNEMNISIEYNVNSTLLNLIEFDYNGNLLNIYAEKDGFIFDGWYNNPEFSGEVITSIGSGETGNETLYAKWDTTGDVYNIIFVPSRPTDQILSMTEPLSGLLEEELAKLGYGNVRFNISVASSYEAAGEAMIAGTADIAFLPGSTYVAYKDIYDSPINVILAATRGGLSKDSTAAIDWNDGLATTNDNTSQVPYYRGLIIAGPSVAGQAVADIVNAGTDLTWDDVKDLNWCVRSTTSSSGYVYPSLWLQENFSKTFLDVTGTVTQTGGYGDTIEMLANGSCDVGTVYADARRDHADRWTNDFGRTETIWYETNVIGVTPTIMNDTIAVNTSTMDQALIDAITQAFLNLPNTQAGLDVMSVYSHKGYVVVIDEDYDSERAATILRN